MRIKGSSVFSVCTNRLLNLASRGEHKEFLSFFRFASHSLSDLILGEEWAERSYAWMRRFLGLLGRVDTELLRSLGFKTFGSHMEHRKCVGLDGELEQVFRYICQTRQQWVESFLLLERLYGCSTPFSASSFGRKYDIFLLTGDIWSLVKYQTCVFWNRHLNSRESEFPKNALFESLPLFLGSPSLKTFLLRKKAHREVNYTMFMGLKKTLPPLDPVQIWGNFIDLKVDLTKKPVGTIHNRIFDHEKVSDFVEELVSRVPTEERRIKALASYSFGASFSCGRKNCGVAGEVWATVEHTFSMSSLLTPYLRGFSTVHQGSTTMLRTWEGMGPTDREVIERFFELSLFPDRGQVRPHGILEPLKVRIITKGDAATQVALQDVKRYLRALMKGPGFMLTRGSLNERDVEQKFLDSVWLARAQRPDWNFVSGDFSGATNKCNGAISEEILRWALLFAECPDTLVETAVRSLVGNRIHVKLSDTRDGGVIPFSDFEMDTRHYEPFEESYIQTNGQLMGSIISFPILCIMNLICYWMSCNRFHGQRLTLKELGEFYPYWINGDDILFMANDELYRIWQEMLPHFGFEKSLGKNLFLPDAFTINSVYYSLSKIGERSFEINRHEYINLAMITGRRKGDGPNDTIARGTMLGKAFEDYCHSFEFWSAASAAYLEIEKIELWSVRQKAFREFKEVYSPYLERQKWTWDFFLLNHHLIGDFMPKKMGGSSLATFYVEEQENFHLPAMRELFGYVDLFGETTPHEKPCLDLFPIDEIAVGSHLLKPCATMFTEQVWDLKDPIITRLGGCRESPEDSYFERIPHFET